MPRIHRNDADGVPDARGVRRDARDQRQRVPAEPLAEPDPVDAGVLGSLRGGTDLVDGPALFVDPQSDSHVHQSTEAAAADPDAVTLCSDKGS